MRYPALPFFLSTIGKRFANPDAMYVELTFDSVPVLSVELAALLYDKKFAFSFRMDDGGIEAFTNSFALFKGSYPDEQGNLHPGLRYTDGCGNDIMFVSDYATEMNDDQGNFLHNEAGTAGVKKSQLDLSKDFGYGIIYHSCRPANLVGTYNTYEQFVGDLQEFVDLCQEKWNFHPRVSTTPGAFVGDNMPMLNNVDGKSPSFDTGHWASAQRKSDVAGDPAGYRQYAGVLKPLYIAEGLPVSSIGKSYFESGGWYPCAYSTSHAATETEFADIQAICLAMFNSSEPRAWGFFTHNIKYASDEGDRGGLTMADFTTIFQWLEQTYGKSGNDAVWMTSMNSVMEYIFCREYSVINRYDEGSKVILEIIAPQTAIRRPALTLKLNSNIQIRDVKVYNVDRFSQNVRLNTTGILNLEWSNEFFDVADRYVTQAEATRQQPHVDYAQYLTNQVIDPLKKSALQARINAIVVLVSVTWQCDIGPAGASYGTSLPWNTVTCSLTSHAAIQLRDLDSNLTNVYISVAKDFYQSAGISAYPPNTGAGTGIWPDTVIRDGVKSPLGGSTYQTVKQSGIFKIAGLTPGRKVSFKFLLSRSYAQRPTRLRVYNTQSGTATTPFDSYIQVDQNQDNYTRLDELNNCQPNDAGELWLEVWSWNGNEGILNAFEMTEHD